MVQRKKNKIIDMAIQNEEGHSERLIMAEGEISKKEESAWQKALAGTIHITQDSFET